MPSRIREKYSSGTEAKKASGICDTPQMPASTTSTTLDDTRLARKPKPIAETEKNRKKLLAIMPNCAGSMLSSCISGTATMPRIALSMKLMTMNKARSTVTTHPRTFTFPGAAVAMSRPLFCVSAR
nr:hypothetical protein [Achromobacter xylosoxidans]